MTTMEKDVLISIRPNWCEKILSGYKTLEIRKTRPKLKTPFKCYIYQTMTGYVSKSKENDILVPIAYGKVIGEFVCDRIQKTFDPAGGLVDVVDCKMSCVTPKEIIRYADGKALYFWHISDLKIYDTPKQLADFGLSRPPQSWCYLTR